MVTLRIWLAASLAVAALCLVPPGLGRGGLLTRRWPRDATLTNSIYHDSDGLSNSNLVTDAATTTTSSSPVTRRRRPRTDVNSIEGKAVKAVSAECKPELQTVKLNLPLEANSMFTPSCVRLEQCGGCCDSPRLTCRPTRTETVTFEVDKIQYDTEKVTPYLVNATKHLECDCQCEVQEENCNPAIESYDKANCACVCKNKLEKKKCLEDKKKFWSDKTCSCYCRKPKPCDSDKTFSQITCECEKPS